MKRTRCAVATAAAFLFVAYAVSAQAQSVCSTIKQYGDVLTVGQWQQCFTAKQDGLGYTPINQAGGVMTGRLVTAASTASRAGFAISPGTAPTSPGDGDVWVDGTGIYVRVNGSTVGPLASSATVNISVGSTAISGGVTKGLLYNNGGVVGNLATVNNGVLVTSAAGVPSIATALPSGITIPGMIASNATLSGTPTMPGLSSGSCVNGIGLDSSNNVIKTTCNSVASSVQLGTTGVGNAVATNNILTSGTVSGGNGTMSSSPVSADGSGNLSGVVSVQNTAGVAVQGTNTNDNAGAGYVGEYVESPIASGSAVAISNSTPINLTSLSLTAGDWDVYCLIIYKTTSSTITAYLGSISTTSNTMDTGVGNQTISRPTATFAPTGDFSNPFLMRRLSVASTTPTYCVAQLNYSNGSPAIYGKMWARRAR